MYRADNKIWFEKRALDLTVVSKIEILEEVILAEYNLEGQNIYLFCKTPNSEFEKKVVQLNLDGSQFTLTNSITFDEEWPRFKVNNSFIYAFSGYGSTSSTTIQQFDLGGNMLNSISYSNYLVDYNLMNFGGLFLLFNDFDSNPNLAVKVEMLAPDLTKLLAGNFGLPQAIPYYLEVDEDNSQFFVTGNTELHYNMEGLKSNDKLYFLRASFNELVPGFGGKSDIKVSPNPTKKQRINVDVTNVDLNDTNGLEIQFTDLQGRVILVDYRVLAKGLLEIDISNLDSGINLISIKRNEQQLGTAKFLVE